MYFSRILKLAIFGLGPCGFDVILSPVWVRTPARNHINSRDERRLWVLAAGSLASSCADSQRWYRRRMDLNGQCALSRALQSRPGVVIFKQPRRTASLNYQRHTACVLIVRSSKGNSPLNSQSAAFDTFKTFRRRHQCVRVFGGLACLHIHISQIALAEDNEVAT